VGNFDDYVGSTAYLRGPDGYSVHLEVASLPRTSDTTYPRDEFIELTPDSLGRNGANRNSEGVTKQDNINQEALRVPPLRRGQGLQDGGFC